MPNTALVVGATGIGGGNLTTLLLREGWDVYGLARRPRFDDARIRPSA